jgi:hypothetical protein
MAVPTVTSISPNSGPSTGGTPAEGYVTVLGTGFTGATHIYFGTNSPGGMGVISDGEIHAGPNIPAHSIGAVHVTVVAPGGTSVETSSDLYTYTGATTGAQIRIGGNWQPVTATKVNVGGTWQSVSGIHIKVGSNWETIQ